MKSNQTAAGETLSSEANLRLVLDNMEEMVCRFLPDTTLTYVNKGYCKEFGMEPEELIGRRFTDLIPDISHSYITDKLSELSAENPKMTMIHQATKKDGSVVWQEWVDYYSYNDDEQRVEYQSIGRDITKQRIVMQTLRESEENLRSLITEMPLGLAVHKVVLNKYGELVDAIFLEVNPSFERITGIKRSAIIGKSILEVFPKADRKWLKNAARIPLNGDSLSYQDYSKGLGKYLNVVAFQPKQDEFAVIIEDISKWKKTDRELHISKIRIDHLAEQGKMIIWETDEDGKYTYISKSVENILGYEPDELIGKKSFYDLHPEEGFPEYKQFVDEIMMKREKLLNFETLMCHKNGSIVAVLSQAIPISDFEGNLSGYHGSDTDITERKRIRTEREEALRLKEELAQAQKMYTIGELTSTIVHDFNNVITVVKNQAYKLIGMLEQDSPYYDGCSAILQAARNSEALTKQLLGFSRKEADVKFITDLNEAVSNTLTMFKRIVDRGVTVDWKPNPNVCRIIIKESAISQILLNLCINARDAISQQGTITIRTECTGRSQDSCQFVTLSVRDDGMGMDKETMAKIFKPFFTTKDKDQGTGLGLTSVKRIVKENGGYIEVESELNKGTCFNVFLPCHCDKTEKRQLEEKKKTESRAKTILIIDDEEAILTILKEILLNNDYDVLTARSAGEALTIITTDNREPIDIVLCDIMMPDYDGFRLVRMIKQTIPTVQEVYMTGYPDKVFDKSGGLANIKLIRKPFTEKELIDELSAACSDS